MLITRLICCHDDAYAFADDAAAMLFFSTLLFRFFSPLLLESRYDTYAITFTRCFSLIAPPRFSPSFTFIRSIICHFFYDIDQSWY